MARILVIEDDPQFQSMLVQMLSLDRHSVSTASDGDEGLRMIQSIRPDLVITDILMPRKDGIEMITELTRLGNEVPIVAMSGGRRAISSEFNLQSAALLGVKSLLSKPFTRSDLRQAIEAALG